MTPNQIQKRYYLHTLLHKFTEELFFAFGALLVFAKTQSIGATLLFAVVGRAGSTVMKSIGFAIMTKLVRRWGVITIMTLGLLLKIASLFVIFYLEHGMSHFYPLLYTFALLDGIGNAFYVLGSSAVMFEVIGTSQEPGHSSAYIRILHIMSSLLATIAAVFLAHYGSFTFSFIVGAIVLLCSTIPLWGLSLPQFPDITFQRNLKKISLGMFLANFNPNHEIQITALPLIILGLSASLTLSIWITAAIAIITIFTSYLAGVVRDHHGRWLTWLALFIGIVAWASYGFVTEPIEFLIPSIFVGLATTIISIGREARMSKELWNADNLLGGTMAIEFGRSLGGLVGAGMVLAAYLIFHSLPQTLLMISGLFLIPKAIYAAGFSKSTVFPMRDSSQ